MVDFPKGKGLRGITWDPTNKCNSRCKHCFAASTIKCKNTKSLEFTLYPECLKNLSDRNLHIRFIGGEPTLRTDFKDILKLCYDSGIKSGFATNGKRLSIEFLNSIKDYVDYITVSLDGPENIHDDLRGKGSYCSTMQGVKNLTKAKIPFGIQFTITGHSLPYLSWAIEKSKEYNCKVHFVCLTRGGRASLLDSSYFLKNHDLEEVYNFVLTERSLLEDPNLITIDLYSNKEFKKVFINMRRLFLNLYQIHIQHDGTIMPFIELQHPTLTLGNIANTKMTSILQKSYLKRLLLDEVLYNLYIECMQYKKVIPILTLMLDYTQRYLDNEALVLNSSRRGSPFPFKSYTDQKTCMHCGECIQFCLYKARSFKNGDINIDFEKCVGCSECVYHCKSGATYMLDCINDTGDEISLASPLIKAKNIRTGSWKHGLLEVFSKDGKYMLNSYAYQIFELCENSTTYQIFDTLRHKKYSIPFESLKKAVSILIKYKLIEYK